MLLVLNREVGPIRVKYSPSCAYYYYELFLKDGSRSNDEDDDSENSSQNEADRFLVKSSLSPLIPNTIQFVFKDQIHVREQLSVNQSKLLISLLKEISPCITLKNERKDFSGFKSV